MAVEQTMCEQRLPPGLRLRDDDQLIIACDHRRVGSF
jgi:hypothetical protein